MHKYTADELGMTRPCSCGKKQILSVKGEYDTVIGRVLGLAWHCPSCNKEDYAGVLER